MSNTPRTDNIIRYLEYQFPATVGHRPIRRGIESIELDLNALRKDFDMQGECLKEWMRVSYAIQVSQKKPILETVAEAMSKMSQAERNSFFAEVKHQWLLRLPKAEEGASKF